MPATPTYGLAYPALTDPPDAPGQLQALAEGVEAELARVDNDVENAITDTGLLTNLSITPATGWTVGVKEHRIIAGVMYLRLSLDRSGGELSGSAAGNIADTPMATLTSAGQRPQVSQMASVRFSNTGGTVQLSASTGEITLTDLHTNGSVGTGNTGQMNFVYPLA